MGPLIYVRCVQKRRRHVITETQFIISKGVKGTNICNRGVEPGKTRIKEKADETTVFHTDFTKKKKKLNSNIFY